MYDTYHSTENIEDEDIVIGISAFNEEHTILNVLNVVQEGLLTYFPQYNSTIVVAAGDSDDKTVELAKSASLPNGIGLKIINEKGKGKGCAIKALMEVSQEINANMLGLVDGDLISIRPAWIAHMLEPIRYGLTEFVSPRYIRGKHDGGITKLFSYPLISTLFGEEVRQPIGGEMAMDSEFVKMCLEKENIPKNFGIDTFLTFHSLANNFRISQAALGPRFHASTGEYSDPTELLGPMFEQVGKTTFDLIKEHKQRISESTPLHQYRTPYRKFDNYKGMIPTTPSVDLDLFWDEADEIITKNEESAEKIAPDRDNIIAEIRDKNKLDADKWSEIVINAISEYMEKEDDQIIHALKGFWYARYVSFINETEDKDIEETEEKVYHGYHEFSEKREKLIEELF